MDALVSTAWLAASLGELTVVDCSWHMPASGRSGREEYLAAHIPGARFLDIDDGRRPVEPCAAHASHRRGFRGGDGSDRHRQRRPHRRL